MARTKISEFSATPADNTDIDNIDIAEGCAPSGINNAIRELMAQLKDFQTGSAGDSFNGAVNGSLGATTPSTVVATQVDITAQGDLRLQDTTGGQYVALQAPSTVATSYTLTLPVDDGTSGQALITDGSGVTSWSNSININGTVGATTPATGAFTTLSYTGTLTGGTGIINIGSGQFYKDASGNVGIATIPSGLLTNGKAVAIGDSDTGIRQNGDGIVEVVANNVIRTTFGSNINFFSNDKGAFGSRTVLLQDNSSSDGQPGLGFHAVANGTAGIFKFYGLGNNFEFRNSIDSGFVDAKANTFINASDYRLKQNIQPSNVGLQAVMALKPVKFSWKNDGKEVIGFLAHEAQEVVPEAVTGEKDAVNPVSLQPDFQGMKDSVLIAVLVKAIQELKTEFDAYKASHP